MFADRDQLKFTTAEISLMLPINRIFFNVKDVW